MTRPISLDSLLLHFPQIDRQIDRQIETFRPFDTFLKISYQHSCLNRLVSTISRSGVHLNHCCLSLRVLPALRRVFTKPSSNDSATTSSLCSTSEWSLQPFSTISKGTLEMKTHTYLPNKHISLATYHPNLNPTTACTFSDNRNFSPYLCLKRYLNLGHIDMPRRRPYQAVGHHMINGRPADDYLDLRLAWHHNESTNIATSMRFRRQQDSRIELLVLERSLFYGVWGLHWKF